MAFRMLFSALRGRILLPMLLLLVILSGVLAACGQGPAQSSSKQPVLTIVPSPIGDFTRNFNPLTPTADYGSLGMIYETLLYFNSLDGSVKPWLASSYQFSSDAKTITFTLRDGVKWSDGQPFTADDVVFTLNLLKQYPALDINALWQTVTSVTAPDQHTVVVTFNKAYTPILWYLAGQTYIVPKHLWSNVGDASKYSDPNPVGTGPYVLKSFTPQLIALQKNPNFWQPGKPLVQQIHYPAYNSGTSTSIVLGQGQIDWGGLYTPGIQQTYVSLDPTQNHYWFPPHNVVMLYLNEAKAPFNSVSFRQAISDVLDRQQMYQVGESGYEPVASPTGLVLPANKSFLDQSYANSAFSINTQQAQQLLQSDGYTKNAAGVLVNKSGKALPTFNLDVVTGWTDWVQDCQIMVQNLKTIGINAVVNTISYNSYYSALQLGTYDMAISWTNPGPTPYYLFNSVLNSANTAPLGKAAASNFERWSSPQTDQLLTQYATSTSSATQQQILNSIEKIMVEQLPAIPLVYGATWYEYRTSNFTGWPDASNPYAVPAPWSYPDNEMVILNLKPVA